MINDDKVWIVVPASVYASGGGPAMVLDHERKRVVEVSPLIAQLLLACKGAKTYGGHLDAAWLAGITRDSEALASGLDSLIEYGLLRQIQFAVPGSGRVPDRVTSPVAVVVTANRHSSLAAALASLARSRPRRTQALVIDGSQDRSACERTYAVTTGGAKPSLDMGYVGRHSRAALDAVLRFCQVDQKLAAFALSPGEIGANRNIALLLGAGRQLVMTDDDVICHTWVDEAATLGRVQLAGHSDVRLWQFYPSRQAAFGSLHDVDSDVVAEHAKYTGRSLRQVLGCDQPIVAADSACPHLLHGLCSDEGMVIRATFVGLAGDAARYCSHAILFMTGQVRERLIAEVDTFHLATTSREISAVALEPTVSHGPWCASYCMGIDNTQLVPPFMPIGRNEDGVWGALLALMDPRAVHLHIPVGVRHDSCRPSRYETAMQSARESRLSEFLIGVIDGQASAITAASCDERLRQIGDGFLRIGALPLDEFIAVAMDSRLHQFASRMQKATAGVPPGKAYSHWREACDRYQELFRASARARDFFVPVEFRHYGSAKLGFAAMQQFVRSFAQLLDEWPLMWRRAASLNHGRETVAGQNQVTGANL
jgi:hypothetical protein